MEIRLQKFLAEAGIASRRKSEDLIIDGKISVNNTVVTQLGVKVDPEKDIVKFKGKTVSLNQKLVYIMLNKPTGYITSLSDEKGRKTVIDLIPTDQRVYPIGRLDYNSSGLLLLTNDGDLTYQLTHPKHEVGKKYLVRVKGQPSESKLNALRKGVDLGIFRTSKCTIRTIKSTPANTLLEVVIHEGKNRMIRRMFEYIEHPVFKLKRVAIGKIVLGQLEVGKYRYLTKQEIQYLKSI